MSKKSSNVTPMSQRVGGITRSNRKEAKSFVLPKGLFSSFADLGNACGICAASAGEPQRVCHKCNKQMHRVEGTNVFVCPECGKRVMQHVHEAPTSLI